MNEIVAAAKGCGGRGIAYSSMKRAWTEKVAWHARAAGLNRRPSIRISLQLRWIEPKRKNGATRDPDNIHAGAKFLMDGLKLAGAIPDDKQANIASITHLPIEFGVLPGVEVTVTPVE